MARAGRPSHHLTHHSLPRTDTLHSHAKYQQQWTKLLGLASCCHCCNLLVADTACGRLIHLPPHTQVTRAEWACRDKGPERSTCEVLMELAQEHNIDLLVVGSFGRKGEKL